MQLIIRLGGFTVCGDDGSHDGFTGFVEMPVIFLEDAEEFRSSPIFAGKLQTRSI
jgi:hypothetical protein